MKKTVLALLIAIAMVSIARYAERAYWAYWPFIPMVVCPEPIKIENAGKVIMAGSLLIYTVTIDKKLPGACIVKRQLVNSYRIDYDPVTPPEKELGPQKVTSSIHIPSFVDPGEWWMRWTIECPTGGPYGRKISITRNSEPFRVISGLDKGQRGDAGIQGKTGPAGKDGKNFWGK